MRVIINKDSEVLAGEVIKIDNWFARKEGLDVKEATIERQTEKAYFMKYSKTDYDGDRVEVTSWVPKSVSHVVKLESSLDRWI